MSSSKEWDGLWGWTCLWNASGKKSNIFVDKKKNKINKKECKRGNQADKTDWFFIYLFILNWKPGVGWKTWDKYIVLFKRKNNIKERRWENGITKRQKDMPEVPSPSVDSEGSQLHPSCPPADNTLQWFHKQNPQVPLVSSLLRTAQFPRALPTQGSFHLHWLLQGLSAANTGRAWHRENHLRKRNIFHIQVACVKLYYTAEHLEG